MAVSAPQRPPWQVEDGVTEEASAEGVHLSEDELTGYVRDNLARFKAPREVVFVDEVPRNPTGKVVKAELQRERGERS
jgi:acyl-CoA synthetase (AMP-forming)/AMP-acid ligase II